MRFFRHPVPGDACFARLQPTPSRKPLILAASRDAYSCGFAKPVTMRVWKNGSTMRVWAEVRKPHKYWVWVSGPRKAAWIGRFQIEKTCTRRGIKTRRANETFLAFARRQKKKCRKIFLHFFMGSALVLLPFKPLGSIPTFYIADDRSCVVALFYTFNLQSYLVYLRLLYIVACSWLRFSKVAFLLC